MFPPATECGVFALTAFWSDFEIPSAHCCVSAFWIPAWKPPAPPQPAKQPSFPSLPSRPSHPQPLPTSWLSVWSWSVLALFETSVVAVEVAAWLASASCSPPCRPPAPPQPATQPTLPSRPSLPSQPQSLPPTCWLSSWSWSVFALFETSVVAVEVAAWLALESPELTSLPAMDTGTLAFTAVWSDLLTPRAACSVLAFWIPSWKPPEPPQPATQPSFPPRS